MDKSYPLYLLILSTTTLSTDINLTGEFSYDWFDAQNHCIGLGLTREKDKTDQPYWTGIYRRLTPWINILGCYADYIETLQNVVNKTMTISSVGMCQEMCSYENIHKFAVKMNKCLCIESNTRITDVSPFNLLPASDCNFKCGDDIYLGDCGGESAYNIYETQKVQLNHVETCLSVQCSTGDERFIPRKCSESLGKVCENMTLPDYGYASSWRLSMEQCRKSQPSTYLLGDIDLNKPRLVCLRLPHHLKVIWVGVARQKYTSIDQGWGINEEQRETFLECQMCERNACQYRSCFNLSASSIFCKNISDRFQGRTTSNLMSNHSTSDVICALRSTTRKSGTNEDLVLKISLPLTIGFITLFLCVVGVVLYKRRGKITKTDGTTKAEVISVPQTQVYSELDFAQSNSSFTLEHCYQKISKGIGSLNESPYNNLEKSVNDHLKVKQAQEKEGNNIYQNASTDMTGDMFGYDTIANTVNKNKE